MDGSRRNFLAGTAATLALIGAPRRLAASTVFTPEMFGAVGDGVTNDTRAFGRLSAAVNAQGGGAVELRRGSTYLVGEQEEGGRYYLTPLPVLEFHRCHRPLLILGNGARIRCAPDLRYGTFDRRSGRALQGQGRVDQIATPYLYMIGVQNCTGGVRIENVELDGNIERQAIGGGYDTTGRQIAMTGIFLKDNDCIEVIRNVLSHHHGLDGLIIDGLNSPAGALHNGSQILNYEGRNNGRQALSVVGGVGYKFVNCKFNYTGVGTGRLGYSAPGAGVDIEAEGGKKVRDLLFSSCEFLGNIGCQMVAAEGDSSHVRFENCRIIGDVNWSVWPSKPFFLFQSCAFVGAIVNLYGGARDPRAATRFEGCTFRNDPEASPSGKVFSPGNVMISGSQWQDNEFTQCSFIHAIPGTASNGVRDLMRFQDCTFRARAGQVQFAGRFSGTTRFIEEGGRFYGLPGGGPSINDIGESEGPVEIVRTGVSTRHGPTVVRR